MPDLGISDDATFVLDKRFGIDSSADSRRKTKQKGLSFNRVFREEKGHKHTLAVPYEHLRDRATGINFRLELVDNVSGRRQDTVSPIFGNSCVGEIINFGTCTAHSTKGVAGFAGIGSTARGVKVLANPFTGFRGTGEIRLAGVVGDVSFLNNKVVCSSVRSSMTAASNTRATIQNKLDRQVDFVLGRIGNLDSIRQG